MVVFGINFWRNKILELSILEVCKTPSVLVILFKVQTNIIKHLCNHAHICDVTALPEYIYLSMKQCMQYLIKL